MEPDARLIAEAWKVAGCDLGVDVVSPAVLHDVRGHPVEYPALLPQFGGPRGLLVIAGFDQDRLRLAGEAGYACSCLYPEFHGSYGREAFVAMLVDWCWVGEQPPPTWYVEGELAEPGATADGGGR